MTITWEFEPNDICHRCGEIYIKHPEPKNFSKFCDNPRYLRNKYLQCGCEKESLNRISREEKDKRNPFWRIDTHCCFCHEPTRMIELQRIKINETYYEQCSNCENKTYLPTPEEISNKRKRKGKNQEDERSRKRSKTPPDTRSLHIPNDQEREEISKKIIHRWEAEEEKARERWCTQRCQFYNH